MEKVELTKYVERLLWKTGEVENFFLESIPGGKNNKVFVVHLKDRKLILKEYFTSANDKRDRLGAEKSFLSYADKINLHSVPKLIKFDRKKNLALFKYIEGRKIKPKEIRNLHISTASSFIQQLNSPENLKIASKHKILNASEACFDINTQIATVEWRLKELEKIQVGSDLDKKALDLVSQLKTLLKEKTKLIKNLFPNDQLDKLDKCISPSDFGFHNALVNKNKEIYFFDFEYAGWDDPVKLICDFFCQPQVPIPLKYFEDFSNSVLGHSRNKEYLISRAKASFPLFQIKWCCILLNEFLPKHMGRRSFAGSVDNIEEKKLTQLQKCLKAYSGID